MRPYALKLYFPQIGGDSLLTVNGVLVFLACEALKIVFRPREKQAVFFMTGNVRIYSFLFRNMPSSLFVMSKDNRVFDSFHKMTDLTFLLMLYIWTDASILSYVKILSCGKDLIPGLCGQKLNNSELHKY